MMIDDELLKFRILGGSFFGQNGDLSASESTPMGLPVCFNT